MHTPAAPSRGSFWPPLAICAVVLVVLAWIGRYAVDRNGGYFSNSEMRVWMMVMGGVAGACLVTGLALVRRPVGRGIVLGTVLAALTVGVGLFTEILVNSA